MLVLTDSQQVVLKLSALSAAGNPAPLENPTVTSSDESIVTVASQDDGSFLIASTGKLGTSQIVANADAKIGEGVSEITGTDTIEVVAGEGVLLGLSFGEPSTK